MAITPNEAKALVRKKHAQDEIAGESGKEIREERERERVQEVLDSLTDVFNDKVTEAATKGESRVTLLSLRDDYHRHLLEKAGNQLRVIFPGFKYVVCSRKGNHPGQGDDGAAWITVYWDNLASYKDMGGGDLNRISDPRILQ